MNEVSLVNVMAAMILNICYNANGLDSVGHIYLGAAFDMAFKIGAFDPPRPDEGRKMSNAKGFTAWSLYRWAV